VALVATMIKFEEKLLLQELERRQVAHERLDDRRLVFGLGGSDDRYSVVLNRSISQTRRLQVARLFEAQGIPVVNSSAVVGVCDDKLATSLALAKHGVPTPPTAVALSVDAGVEAIERVGYPAVVKPLHGSGGRTLAKVNDRDAAEAVLAHKAALSTPQQRVVYAQEYIEKRGRDIRAAVVGDRVVGAMYRISEGWITNTARGSRVEPRPVDAELEAVALAAAAAVGGGAVAVDVVERPDGTLVVVEVNSAMEFHGLVEACGTGIVEALIDHVLEAAASR
jgi:[lysine-biosynthesis-protein LysW]--L-2-aminoadipate ligase